MAHGVGMNDASTLPHGLPPSQGATHILSPAVDRYRAYLTAGSTASMPTLAPGMYNYHHLQVPPTGAQSTTSNASQETHMSKVSRRMIQLTQSNQLIASTQK